MSPLLQNLIIGVVVLGALVYLFFYWRRARRTSKECRGCKVVQALEQSEAKQRSADRTN